MKVNEFKGELIKYKIYKELITNVEIKDNYEFNQIIEIIKNNSNENSLIKHKGLCTDNKRGIVLATLYLFLVYEEITNDKQELE